MLKAAIYSTKEEAKKAIEAIDKARHPDGTEVVTVLPGTKSLQDPKIRERCTKITLPDGSVRLGYREVRPAKPWAAPIELEDGRAAVPWRDDRLASLAGREVAVRGERVRVPRAAEVVELETEEQPDGRVVVRERRTREEGPRVR